MVTQLAGLGFPMRWLAENFLHVGQWADMQQEAFDEKATTAMLDMTLQMRLQQMQMQAQQQQQGAMMGGQGMAARYANARTTATEPPDARRRDTWRWRDDPEMLAQLQAMQGGGMPQEGAEAGLPIHLDAAWL